MCIVGFRCVVFVDLCIEIVVGGWGFLCVFVLGGLWDSGGWSWVLEVLKRIVKFGDCVGLGKGRWRKWVLVFVGCCLVLWFVWIEKEDIFFDWCLVFCGVLGWVVVLG